MSEAALDTLDRAATELRAAMESGDTGRITDAVTAFGPALETVRGISVWHVNDQFQGRSASTCWPARRPARPRRLFTGARHKSYLSSQRRLGFRAARLSPAEGDPSLRWDDD